MCPLIATIAPGETGEVAWTYQNAGGAGAFAPSGASIVFNAPGYTAFPAQTTVPIRASYDGQTCWLAIERLLPFPAPR